MVLLFDSGAVHASPLRWESKYHTGRVVTQPLSGQKQKEGLLKTLALEGYYEALSTNLSPQTHSKTARP